MTLLQITVNWNDTIAVDDNEVMWKEEMKSE
jgi:hypothetical protein